MYYLERLESFWTRSTVEMEHQFEAMPNLCGLTIRLLILRLFIGLCKRGSNDKRECNGGFGINLESQSATLLDQVQEPPSCSP
jgi:hypothetical protein